MTVSNIAPAVPLQSEDTLKYPLLSCTVGHHTVGHHTAESQLETPLVASFLRDAVWQQLAPTIY